MVMLPIASLRVRANRRVKAWDAPADLRGTHVAV